jgi:hypothetical protein
MIPILSVAYAIENRYSAYPKSWYDSADYAASQDFSDSLLVQAAVTTQPVNLVAAIAAITKSGVVPPHSESGYCRNGC